MADPVLDAGMRAVSCFQKRQLPSCGVGRERLVTPAIVFFEQRQLRTGVRPFTADDHPGAGRVSAQVEQTGEFGDVPAFAQLPVGVDRRAPGPRGEPADRCPNMVIGRESDAELDMASADLVLCDEPVKEAMRASGAISADQQVAPIPGRDLTDRRTQDGDVVRRRVRAGVARAQLDRQALSRLLETERKLLTHTIRMSAYNSESALARLLRPHYSRSDREGRALLREAFTLSGDLQIIGTTLHIRLDPASAPRRSKALAALCIDLNDTKTRYPGTELTLVYGVKEHPTHT